MYELRKQRRSDTNGIGNREDQYQLTTLIDIRRQLKILSSHAKAGNVARRTWKGGVKGPAVR